jgi:hypothetical protein
MHLYIIVNTDLQEPVLQFFLGSRACAPSSNYHSGNRNTTLSLLDGYWESLLPINEERNARARGRLVEVLRTGISFAVTGAGVSAWAGYGTWTQIIGHLASAVREGASGVDTDKLIEDNPNPLHCAQRLGAYLGSRFVDFIRAEFGPNGAGLGEPLYRLCALPFRHFVTFNFDSSMEQVHAALDRQCGSISSSDLLSLTDFMRVESCPETVRQVLHVHGVHTDPPDLIALTDDGYRRLYIEGSLFRRFVWWLTTSKSLVFVGFGFVDSDFLGAMRQAAWEIKGAQLVHFAIKGIHNDENDEAIRNTLNDTYKLDPVFYEVTGDRNNPGHEGFGRLLNGILAELNLPAPVARVVPAVDVPAIAPAEADDIRRAERLGQQIVERLDPGGDDVPN